MREVQGYYPLDCSIGYIAFVIGRLIRSFHLFGTIQEVSDNLMMSMLKFSSRMQALAQILVHRRRQAHLPQLTLKSRGA